MNQTSKVFLGLLMTKEVLFHLNQSSLWKEKKIEGSTRLVMTTIEKKEYIGYYLLPMASYIEILEKEKEMLLELKNYCPKIAFEEGLCLIKPLLFIE